MTALSPNSDGNFIVPIAKMRRFFIISMEKAGAETSHAEQLADVLIAADYRGHFSHGLNRLQMYITDLESGAVKGSGEPTILKEKAGTAWVDGNNVMGPVVGNFCMGLAIKKAKDVGIGWISAKGSNHFGIAGWYSMRATQHGCMGMAFTNTSPITYPTRSSEPFLGTNPLSVAASGRDGDSFVLDMATSAVAFGKGHCFVAIDTSAFAPGFQDRIQSLMDTARHLPSVDSNPVMVAGDPEREHMELCNRLGGIPYHKNQIAYAKDIAEKLGVSFP